MSRLSQSWNLIIINRLSKQQSAPQLRTSSLGGWLCVSFRVWWVGGGVLKSPTYCFVILRLLFWSWKFIGLPYIILETQRERDREREERETVYVSLAFSSLINFDICANIEVLETTKWSRSKWQKLNHT